MSAETRYRIVCANGKMRDPLRTTNLVAAEERAQEMDRRTLNCGPHHIEEVPDGE
jgi:hypothetical protein